VFFVVPAALLLWFWPSPSRALRQRYVGAIVVAGVLALAAATVAGGWHYDARPFVTDASVHPLLAHGADNGFPSDHALLAFTVAGVIAWWRRAAGVTALALATLVALARVIVGVHWPIDVFTSALIGLVAAAIATYTVPLWAYPQRVGARVLPSWLVAAPDAPVRAVGEVAR
jgi:undecaprenyl-diphosphatase